MFRILCFRILCVFLARPLSASSNSRSKSAPIRIEAACSTTRASAAACSGRSRRLRPTRFRGRRRRCCCCRVSAAVGRGGLLFTARQALVVLAGVVVGVVGTKRAAHTSFSTWRLSSCCLWRSSSSSQYKSKPHVSAPSVVSVRSVGVPNIFGVASETRVSNSCGRAARRSLCHIFSKRFVRTNMTRINLSVAAPRPP